MSSFYQFWVGQQTIPGNVVPDLVIGAATYVIGKYKVAPWLHKRHQDHLEQKERHHQEEMSAHEVLLQHQEKQHQALLARQEQQHQELLDRQEQQHQELLDQHQQLLDATRANNPADAPSDASQ